MALLTASKLSRLLLLILFPALASSALASNTCYVDGVNGNDSNDCMSALTACKTIGHTIKIAHSADFIMVAPATYVENLTIAKNLRIIGSDAATTIVDGNQAGTVFTISNPKAYVRLSKLTIRNGYAAGSFGDGGGVKNWGILTIDNSVISGNAADNSGGAILNTPSATLTINNSTITGNRCKGESGGIDNVGHLTLYRSTVSNNSGAYNGGGINNAGIAGINTAGIAKVSNSTISGNSTSGYGGGMTNNGGLLTIDNSTITNNNALAWGGLLTNYGGSTMMSSSTISGNSATYAALGGLTTVQNTIVANNIGGNCSGSLISNGYNLSSDNSCNFTGPGDMNNTDPKLGALGYHGGPTNTVPIQPGSPAIDAGNPNGCTDSDGNLLKTDQRGFIRPDPEESVGCDIGAFERQKNK